MFLIFLRSRQRSHPTKRKRFKVQANPKVISAWPGPNPELGAGIFTWIKLDARKIKAPGSWVKRRGTMKSDSSFRVTHLTSHKAPTIRTENRAWESKSSRSIHEKGGRNHWIANTAKRAMET